MFDFSYHTDNGFDIKSITAYRDTDIFYSNNPDYAVIDLLTIEYSDKYQQWSQEFQLISPQGKSPFNYVAGLYLYKQDADTQRDAINGAQSSVLGNVPDSVIFNSGNITTGSYAAYINSGYELSTNTTLGLGLRYTDEQKDLDWLLDGSNSGVFRIGSTNGTLQDSRNDNYISYAVNISHKLKKNLNVYAKYSTGFKSGGYNLDYITNNNLDAGIAFDKETVGSSELGLKGNFNNNSLSLNVAAFNSEFKNYQVNQFIDLGNGTSSISIRNAAKVTTKGLELELTYHPITDLEIQASVGLMDTKFDDFPGGLTGGGNAKGKVLINAPDSNFSLSIQYLSELPALNADMLWRLDMNHNTGFFTTVDNVKSANLKDGTVVDFGHVNSITLINARIGLMGTNSGWETYLWGRNLANVRSYR